MGFAFKGSRQIGRPSSEEAGSQINHSGGCSMKTTLSLPRYLCYCQPIYDALLTVLLKGVSLGCACLSVHGSRRHTELQAGASNDRFLACTRYLSYWTSKCPAFSQRFSEVPLGDWIGRRELCESLEALLHFPKSEVFLQQIFHGKLNKLLSSPSLKMWTEKSGQDGCTAVTASYMNFAECQASTKCFQTGKGGANAGIKRFEG